MLRSSAISCSSVTDFCFSSAISTRTRSGSEKRGGEARRPERRATHGTKTTGWVAWGEIRGGEQPTRGIWSEDTSHKKEGQGRRSAPSPRVRSAHTEADHA